METALILIAALIVGIALYTLLKIKQHSDQLTSKIEAQLVAVEHEREASHKDKSKTKPKDFSEKQTDNKNKLKSVGG